MAVMSRLKLIEILGNEDDEMEREIAMHQYMDVIDSEESEE